MIFSVILPKHELHVSLISGAAADPSVVCSECPRADNSSAKDWRPSQSQQAAASPGTSGQY